MVVTTQTDEATKTLALNNDCSIFTTNVFYEDGAHFNKWRALETALHSYGRHGWIVNMDADVLWPKVIPDFELDEGCLYTPMRRMFHDLGKIPAPDEQEWNNYSYHRYQKEWSGYTQIYHAGCSVLDKLPWYETDWKHAGGGDSTFQGRWESSKKLRPSFEVLHLGGQETSGTNWLGRWTPYVDGTQHPDALQREQASKDMMELRRSRPRKDRGDYRYSNERII
jgi:hypothetical protein